ncbi:unnamed protein product, partial [Chrysoparadoxa australica]
PPQGSASDAFGAPPQASAADAFGAPPQASAADAFGAPPQTADDEACRAASQRQPKLGSFSQPPAVTPAEPAGASSPPYSSPKAGAAAATTRGRSATPPHLDGGGKKLPNSPQHWSSSPFPSPPLECNAPSSDVAAGTGAFEAAPPVPSMGGSHPGVPGTSPPLTPSGFDSKSLILAEAASLPLPPQEPLTAESSALPPM